MSFSDRRMAGSKTVAFWCRKPSIFAINNMGLPDSRCRGPGGAIRQGHHRPQACGNRRRPLEEGVLLIDAELGCANNGSKPPVIHVDTDARLISTVDGSILPGGMWGICDDPDWHFGDIRDGASRCKVETPVNEMQIDPYGLSLREIVASDEFAHMGMSALAAHIKGDKVAGILSMGGHLMGQKVTDRAARMP